MLGLSLQEVKDSLAVFDCGELLCTELKAFNIVCLTFSEIFA